MRLRFLFIGRTKCRYLAEGIDDFHGRIKAYLPTEMTALKGAKVRSGQDGDVRAADTGRLLAAVKPNEVFVHLDPGGRQMTSEELAAWLKEQMDRGAGDLVFGLGGSIGLDDSAAQRANLRLCLSRMTLTHEMCRLVLLEQIYRALRLISGHPYHK